jgi:hypothetical protein
VKHNYGQKDIHGKVPIHTKITSLRNQRDKERSGETDTMKILLTDASSLTSRQVATILHNRFYEVHALNSSGTFFALCNLTSCVRKTHPVPSFGADPYVWLEALIKVWETEKETKVSRDQGVEERQRGRRGKGFDVLIVTQEMIAIVAAEKERLLNIGVKFAVPEFEALRRVMGKRGSMDALRRAGLDIPETLMDVQANLLGGMEPALPEAIVTTLEFLPGYLKTDIGTASRGVTRVETITDLRAALSSLDAKTRDIVILQKEIQGNLVMISGVFAHSCLLAWHACLRTHAGPGGGATKKISLPLSVIETQLRALGKELGWHGALSADAILNGGDVWWIDINPRICEPVNAYWAGTDMLGALIDVSFGLEEKWEAKGKGRIKGSMEGVETHQLLLAFMAAVEHGRAHLIVEVFTAIMGFERYAGSKEELTPFDGDLLWSSSLLVAVVLVLFVGGKSGVDLFRGGAVGGYALTREGWEMILKREDEKMCNAAAKKDE